MLIAMWDTVKVFPREDLLCDSELLFVEILASGNRKVNLGVFYRPPKSDINPLLNLQTALDSVLWTPNSDLLLLGDFNMPEINWETNCALRSSDHTMLLCEIIQDNFLTQLVKDPTREENILDLAFVSSPDLVHDLTVGQPFSDHNSINLLLSRSSHVGRRSEKLAYSFRKADWEHLRNLLNHTPWHCAFLEDNIDLVWSAWSDLLLPAVDECIPKHRAKRSTNAPWINRNLIKLCRKKKLLYKRAKKSSKESDWVNYRKLNNHLKKECNSARWRYINNLTEDLKSNTSPKPFWNYVKSKRKGSSDLVSLKVNDELLNDDISIANSMNYYFSSVFTIEDQANFPDFDYVTNQKLCNIYCSPAEVAKMLNNLNIYKSPRPDGIPPRILKECSQVLSSPLALLLNTSFSLGQLQTMWKNANITPVYKKGNRNFRENYRQISLTCILCKISEKVVRNGVVDFWSDLDLFNPNQFTYLSGKSTLLQLLECYNDWAQARNCSTPTDVILLGLSKAFDHVPQERLLLKLNRHGIDGPLLRWFRHFLTNRVQRVVIRGKCLDWLSVKSGVPQGTILGPILFIIYKNDISTDLASTVKIHADDTKIYRTIGSPDVDIPALQCDLDRLGVWANKWQMNFHLDKCEVMRITHRKDKTKPIYSLGGQFRSVENTKDLGVTISSDLSWGKHVFATVNKANIVLGTIKRSIGTNNRDVFSQLYKSLVRPILEYAAPVWSPYLIKDIVALEKVQRRASRLALRQKHGEMSYEHRCSLLKWQTLEKQREFLSLVQCYKIVFGIDHLSFPDFFEFAKSTRTRANHNYKLYLRKAVCNCYKYPFFIRMVRKWNDLPRYVVHAESLSVVKSRLKIYLNIY